MTRKPPSLGAVIIAAILVCVALAAIVPDSKTQARETAAAQSSAAFSDCIKRISPRLSAAGHVRAYHACEGMK